TWAWSFGDGTSSTTKSPQHTYANAGTYTVSLKVTGPGGSATKTAAITVQAHVTGLVAAYSFDEGSGTTVIDTSGQGNNGTISGATWTTAGRFGNALVFNGTNALVTIPDAVSLRLTTGMTLEAWVYPTGTPTTWMAVLMKEQPGSLVYALYASSPYTQPW